MRLFEAILDANHRALQGDSRAGLRPADFPNSLPVVALTCIDPRLNRLLPEALGIREEDFIWLRNAGNIIFEPLSSMMRTLALACAVKGGKEIALIGHTDCKVRQVSVAELIDMFRALGIARASLPDNLTEFFGLFASERQNVINGVNHIRRSPLVSPQVPVHGLMIDTDTGRLEWLINGYDQLGIPQVSSPVAAKLEQAKESIEALGNISLGDLKLPDLKISEMVKDPHLLTTELRALKSELKDEVKKAITHPGAPPQTAPASNPEPPKVQIPVPPPIRMVKNPPKPKH